MVASVNQPCNFHGLLFLCLLWLQMYQFRMDRYPLIENLMKNIAFLYFGYNKEYGFCCYKENKKDL